MTVDKIFNAISTFFNRIKYVLAFIIVIMMCITFVIAVMKLLSLFSKYL